ncbi:hypothetical protein PMIN04_012553 [Paraphaeosphaeria minitans]
MSLSTSSAMQNNGTNREDATLALSATNPTWKMSSRLEGLNGVLRVDSDGKIISEETGDLVHLDIPDDEAQQYYSEVDPHALSRRFAIPEMKNGATALDDPRARKPILRVVKNWLTGSSKPPVQEPQWAFATALRGWSPMNPGRKPGKIMFGNMVDTRRHEGGAKVRGLMVQALKAWFDEELKKASGRDWAKKAEEHDKFLVKVEDFVTKLLDDTPKINEDDEDYDAAFPVYSSAVESISEAPKKRGWPW